MSLISVVIPTYNRSSEVGRALDSVLTQDFDDVEILVVDDGSTDDTEAVVGSYDDGRISYIQFKRNRGANAARNEAIRRSKGEFISFLDSDDEFRPGHLQMVYETFEEASEQCVGVYTAYEIVDGQDTVRISRAKVSEVSQQAVIKNNIIGGFSCTTFRRSAFDQVGLLDESLPAYQDLDFFIRVLKIGKIVGLDEVLITYHTSGERISTDFERKMEGNKIILNKHEELYDDVGIATRYYSMGFIAAREGRMDLAEEMFRTAVATNPRSPLHWYHYIFVHFGKIWHDRAIRAKTRIKNSIDTNVLNSE